MIRVLEVLATLKRAGAEVLVTSLVSRLDRSRFEPALVTLYDASPNDLEADVRAAGVPVFRLGKKPGFDPRMYPRLRSVIRRFRPNIVHTHSYVMRYSLPVAWRRHCVHTVHNLAEKEVDAVGIRVHRIAWRHGVQPVAVSGVVARSFGQLYGHIPPVIRNGIDVERFAPKQEVRERWRVQHGFDPDERLIVSVARLDPQKNPHALVRALPPDCRLLLVGDGSLRSSLEGMERVHLLGVRSDTPEILSSCDAFALASEYEGHPVALMEAMAAGLPVVATAVGGVPEIVGDAGLLVPPNDLADALRLAISAGQEVRSAAMERARRSFDIGETVRQYEALFDYVVRR